MFYGEMDWQRPGPAWMVGDVAFVSVSVEMGEGASPPFAASIDSEKLPSSPCLRGVVGGSTSSWFLVPIHHPFRLRMHGLISLGPSVTAETHLAMAREEDGQQDWGCAFASWEHVACRGELSEGQAPNCSGPRGCRHCLWSLRLYFFMITCFFCYSHLAPV